MRLAWRLGFRLLRRDLRAGEVRVLLAALALSVFAVTAIGFLTERVGRALDLQANALIGGDAVLRADRPIAVDWTQRAEALALQHTQTRAFASMLRHEDRVLMFDVRAVGPGFPLRGAYRLDRGPALPAGLVAGGPPRGAVWLAAEGGRRLGAAVGDRIKLGALDLRVEAIILQAPDAGFDFFNLAPRAVFHLQDLEASGLDQPGARITHRLIVAGARAAVATWSAEVKTALGRGQRVETATQASPEIRSALQRADRFLGLAALSAVVLAGVAVAMAARRHVQHHLDGCAVMRCFGASHRSVLAIHSAELVMLGLLGSSAGIALAYVAQAALGSAVERMMGVQLPAAGLGSALQGFGVGAAVIAAFALPPLLALRRVSTLRVLRHESAPLAPSAGLVGLLGIGGLAGLLWWRAGSPTLALLVLGGLLGTVLLLAGMAVVLVQLMRRTRPYLRGPLRYGLANVAMRASSTVLQASALGLGILMVLLLTLVRSELIERWQAAIPADAPNRFVINIQPEQVAAVEARLSRVAGESIAVFPMVRGRLTAVNDKPVGKDDLGKRGDRAQRLGEREFNLSTMRQLRSDDNRILEGTFWAADAPPFEPEVSVEQGIAQSLGWSLGDRLSFDIAGSPIDARISSIRKVDWQSFRPNFFVLFSPGSLDRFAATHVTALHVPANGLRGLDELLVLFPNLTVIDVGAVLTQVRRTIDQVAMAVELVFGFTLLAGVLVVLAAIGASQDERLREGSVLRAFGATKLQLRLAQLGEFAALGLLSGAVAALAATVLSTLIARWVFELPMSFDPRIALAGASIGVLVVCIAGLFATRGVINQPPSNVLRLLGD